MKRKILISLIIAILMMSSVIALISTEYGTGVTKYDHTVYEGSVEERRVEDTTLPPKEFSLAQFVNIDLDTFDFKLTDTKEVIFDKDKEEIYFIYTYVSGIPIYDNETRLFDGLDRKKYEYRQPYPYAKYKLCRIARNETTTVCFNEAKAEVDLIVIEKVEKQRARFIKLQNKALGIIENQNDIVYNDVVGN